MDQPKLCTWLEKMRYGTTLDSRHTRRWKSLQVEARQTRSLTSRCSIMSISTSVSNAIDDDDDEYMLT